VEVYILSFVTFGTRPKWVVSDMLCLFYCQGKSFLCPLERRLGAPQKPPGHRGW